MKDRQHNGKRIPKVQSEAVNQWRIDNTMGKRYQRCNQKPYINEGHTTQWAKDTKGAIRSRKSMKDIQHNGQKKKDKRTIQWFTKHYTGNERSSNTT